MTPQPGEKWVVEIGREGKGRSSSIWLNGETWGRPIDYLTPYTEPSPLTALERRVVEAAEEYRESVTAMSVVAMPTRTAALCAAVDALRAAREPPDAVAALIAAARTHLTDKRGGLSESRSASHLFAAIAAVEAERGRK